MWLSTRRPALQRKSSRRSYKRLVKPFKSSTCTFSLLYQTTRSGKAYHRGVHEVTHYTDFCQFKQCPASLHRSDCTVHTSLLSFCLSSVLIFRSASEPHHLPDSQLLLLKLICSPYLPTSSSLPISAGAICMSYKPCLFLFRWITL